MLQATEGFAGDRCVHTKYDKPTYELLRRMAAGTPLAQRLGVGVVAGAARGTEEAGED